MKAKRKKLTRQERWQRKKRNAGLCMQCGKRKRRKFKRVCNKCGVARRKAARKKNGWHKQRAGRVGRPQIVQEHNIS